MKILIVEDEQKTGDCDLVVLDLPRRRVTRPSGRQCL